MKKWSVRIIIALGVLLVFVRILANDAPAVPYYTKARPAVMVIAHQGGDGVWPGDTMYAFQHAVDIGADVLEMDAHITKDSQIVLMHDERVDRTTDGTGRIEEMTLADLRKLDAAYQWSPDEGKTFPFRGQGIQVPTLEQLFQTFPQMRYLIEIKLTANPIDKPLCGLIKKYKMEDKVIVASFHDDAMSAFRAACPQVATSASKGEVTPFVLLGKLGLNGLLSPKFVSLQVPYDPTESYNIPVMTKWFIKQSHNKNVKVEPWTVDDPELMKEYIAWGVDGIITDRPDLMLQILGEAK